MAYKRISPTPVNEGGTGALTLTDHGLLFGSGTGAITASAVGSTGQILLGVSGADPAYSTATYPSTTTVSQILYSSSANTVAGLATANSAILNTSAGGVPSLATSPGCSGTLTAGTGLTATTGNVTVTAGNIAIPATNAGATEGIITVGGNRFLSNFPAANRSTFLGQTSGNTTNTGQNSTGIGYNALLSLTSGQHNTCVGARAGETIAGGDSNIAIGHEALLDLSSGGGNVCIGEVAGQNITTTNYNTAIGYNALSGVVTGTENIALGRNAGSSLTTTDSNNIHIGNSGTVGDNNSLRIGAGSGTGTQQIANAYIQATNMNISTDGVAGTITIGNNTGATAVVLNAGSGGVKLGAVKYPIASATSGKILISNGTDFVASTPTYPTAAGPNGNVLTSDGSNWTSAAASGGGAWVKLLTTNASAASTVVFNSTYITSTYQSYVVQINNLTLSSGSNLQLTFSVDNGSNYLATGYISGCTYNTYNVATWGNTNSTTNLILSTGMSSTVQSSGTIWLYNLGNANPPNILGDMFVTRLYREFSMGSNTTTSTVNNIKFDTTTGTLTGTFTLYGITQ